MFAGKMKALTFSYDDGVTQDQRLISLFNKYGLKATFNLNSELLGKPGSLLREDVTVAHVKPRPVEVRAIYAGHEVAAHTLTHPMLTEQTDDEIVRQVEQDRLNLSELVGYEHGVSGRRRELQPACGRRDTRTHGREVCAHHRVQL